MLALAHGVEGIFYEFYYSYYSGSILGEGLVDLPANNYATTENWEKVQSLATRLIGTLGNTLLGLNYTGDFINIEYQEGPQPENNPQDYLLINCLEPSYFWHAGFLVDSLHFDNKYFLLTNLRTSFPVEAKLIVSNNTDFQNVSFTDIEGGEGRVDTTIAYNTSIRYFEEMPAGEGRLYRVAPVIKYGGRLIYNENAGEGLRLYDDMVIENGAELKIYGTYNAEANIVVKNGSIVNGENGKIIFKEGKKLIIEGTAVVNGTSEDKLEFEFVGEDTDNGIVIASGGSLTITNCIVREAETGIIAELYADYLNAQYVDFIDCENSSVTILGNMGEGEIPPPQIKYCTMNNSIYGISVSNLSQIVIQENSILNTELGISLTNVSYPLVATNTITSNKNELQGIFLESSGGVVRGNTISGHTNGIHLGNSSPDIGGNIIHNNLNRGIYIGYGSLPNMEARLYLDPPIY